MQLAATLQQQLRAEATQQLQGLGAVLLRAIDTLASMQRGVVQSPAPEPLGSPLLGVQGDAHLAITLPVQPHVLNTAPDDSTVSCSVLHTGAAADPALDRAVLAARRADLLARLQAAQLAVAQERRLDLLAAASAEIQALTVAIMQADAQLQVRDRWPAGHCC